MARFQLGQDIIDIFRGKKGANCFVSLPREDKNGVKGNALISYLKDSILLEDGDDELCYHTNVWECREFARIFNRLGYNVDAINWDNPFFKLRKKYDVVLDIHKNLYNLNLGKDCKKILHITGSYPKYANEQDMKRINGVKERRGIKLSPARKDDEKSMDLSLSVADVITLVGNPHTLSTFPIEYQGKINPIPVTSSPLDYVKGDEDYIPVEKEFLWFGGFGAVRKGLDLLLDVFAKHPEWTLNICGMVEKEKDFVKVYQKELFELPNIKYHGFVKPSSETFTNICKKCFCFIYPSCAEGTATAALTALSVGFYPIISEDTGLTLPEGCGQYMTDCALEEIEEKINNLFALSDDEVKRQISETQKFVTTTYTKENFTKTFTEIFKKAGL